jgi:hypothetical protein
MKNLKDEIAIKRARKLRCPTCGSNDLDIRDLTQDYNGVYQDLDCKNCYNWFAITFSVTSVGLLDSLEKSSLGWEDTGHNEPKTNKVINRIRNK